MSGALGGSSSSGRSRAGKSPWRSGRRQRGCNDKLAVLGTLRFFQAYQPTAHKKAILTGMAAVVARGLWRTWPSRTCAAGSGGT